MKKSILLGSFLALALWTTPSMAQTTEEPVETENSVTGEAMEERIEESKKDEKWYFHSIKVVKSGATRYGPTKTGDLYLEYEFFGRKNFLDFYGYVDLPKFFGTATDGYKGFWDGGSVAFIDIQPRASINSILKKDLKLGPIKEWYISANYIGDWGKKKDFGRANNLWLGVGVDIDTKTKLGLSLNGYVRKVWENYQAPNENSWDGFRLKFKYFYPLGKALNGDLSLIGFGDYDFGSKLKDYDNKSGSAFVVTQVLSLSYQRVQMAAVARYFAAGGQNVYDNAPYNIDSNGGWGYYLAFGFNL